MANMSLEETYAEMRQALSEVKECQAHLLLSLIHIWAQ